MAVTTIVSEPMVLANIVIPGGMAETLGGAILSCQCHLTQTFLIKKLVIKLTLDTCQNPVLDTN